MQKKQKTKNKTKKQQQQQQQTNKEQLPRILHFAEKKTSIIKIFKSKGLNIHCSA